MPVKDGGTSAFFARGMISGMDRYIWQLCYTYCYVVVSLTYPHLSTHCG